jgi:hypothetical protein
MIQTLVIRAISLTPCFSWVKDAVPAAEPLERFVSARKPLKWLKILASR